jgi:protein-tyrosine phosphatase
MAEADRAIRTLAIPTTRTVRVSGWRPSPRSFDGGIDEIPLPGSPGRLWLCGKHVVGPDPDAALARIGATTLVCLNESHELAERYPDYVAWLRAASPDRVLWFPVPDLHAPSLPVVRPLLDELRARLDRGDGLLVHCGAGMGRAGTVGACVLLTMGVEREAALAAVAAARPSAGPEVGAQRDLVDALAVSLRSSS